MRRHNGFAPPKFNSPAGGDPVCVAAADPITRYLTLMTYRDWDIIPKFERLTDFVPNADVIDLDCGHWSQEEIPEETNHAILGWLAGQEAP